MELSFAADHSRPRVACVSESEVRATAALTMVIGAVASSYAYFAKQYLPLQVAASLLFAEFLTRVRTGVRHTPIGVVARAMTLDRTPLQPTPDASVMALANDITTAIRGPLPPRCAHLSNADVDGVGARTLPRLQDLRPAAPARWIGATPTSRSAPTAAVRPSSRRTTPRGGLLFRVRRDQRVLAVGALLAFAAPASAAPAPSGDPVRFWSVSKVEQGAGEVPVTSGAQLGGVLEKVVDLGASCSTFVALRCSIMRAGTCSQAPTARITPSAWRRRC